MGLAIEVGALTSRLHTEPDDFEYFRDQFAAVNRYLRAAGLPEHHEPMELDSARTWSGDMYGYSGLHYLRRIALHLDYSGTLPPPGDKSAADDPLDRKFMYAMAGFSGSFLKRLFGSRRYFKRQFDHLLLHSDAEGYYVPIQFRHGIFADEDKVGSGMIGSSYALRRECQDLARVLEIPPDLDADSQELWDATESQGTGATTWQRYGIESFTCVRLLKAAETSIATGAAIVFC